MKVLILSPHTDDGEMSCGGTIVKWLDKGYEIIYVAFSYCQESVPEGFEHHVLMYECREATSLLGIHTKKIKAYKVRRFNESRQEILEEMINLKEEFEPDTVLLPSTSDVHQDHKVICEEGIRAFKGSSNIFGYVNPRNNFGFNPQMFVEINEDQLSKKIEAMKCYKSQEFRNYITEDNIKSVASYYGQHINKPYAEAFEVIRCYG